MKQVQECESIKSSHERRPGLSTNDGVCTYIVTTTFVYCHTESHAHIFTHTRSYTDINFFEAYPHKMDKHLYGFPLALWVYIYKVFKCINVILAGPMLTHDTILNHFLGAHILLSFLILSQVLQPRRGKPK